MERWISGQDLDHSFHTNDGYNLTDYIYNNLTQTIDDNKLQDTSDYTTNNVLSFSDLIITVYLTVIKYLALHPKHNSFYINIEKHP